MRVRLQSLPPLVPLKAWYEIPPLLLSGSSTIEHIKHELCNKFLKQPSQEFSTGNITIELENYEILNDCAVTVLRENDLLVIKYRPSVQAGSKRKRCSAVSSPAPTKTTKTRSRSLSSSSYSSSSSSTSSLTSCSSTSTSSASTSSSTTTSGPSQSNKERHRNLDLGSRLGLAPPRIDGFSAAKSTIGGEITDLNQGSAVKIPQGHQPVGMQRKENPTDFIPPGKGKLSTQKRNMRRKKRRLAEKELHDNNTSPQLRSSPPFSVQAANGSEGTSLPISMYKLKNENKRKGFKKDMQTIIPNRQVFEDSQSSLPAKRPSNFIPPSQQKNLPPNLLVTSVDVEAGEWEVELAPPANKVSGRSLDTLVPTQRAQSKNVSHTLQWDVIEQNWEQHPLANPTHVKVGTVLLWKELGLDPVSFTPELTVRAAKVSSIIEDTFTVEFIWREQEEAVETEVNLNEAETMGDKQDVSTKSLLKLETYRIYSY